LQRKRKIWDQLSSTRKNQVNKARRKGVVLEELTSHDNLREIYKLIDKSNNWKMSNKFPPYQYFENFFNCYVLHGKGKILLSRHNEKIIGGIILGFEQKTVYVLYFWGKEKRYKTYHPTVFTIYSAMELAEKEGYEYFDFMDSGYLNINAGKPRFLLQFGGKPKSTRRWYRFNWGLLNFLAKKIYD
jgi:lipid II:glycine glycyltransferase (peptidoglycan interpeptide bridge formation enzyme)